MSTNTETLHGVGLTVLDEQRPLGLAANAGFGDLVATRLENLAEAGVARPREIFGLYVVALTGVDRALRYPERQNHTKILGEGLVGLFENNVQLDGDASLDERDLHDLFSSLRPETIDILIDTLLVKKIVSPELARRFGAITIDDFNLADIAHLPEVDDGEDPATNAEILNGEKRYATQDEWQKFRPDLVPILYAKNPADLALNFVKHPEALTPELVGIYNLVVRWNIDSSTEFGVTQRWYESLHGATDEGGRLELALARDRKLLLAANGLKLAGSYSQMKGLLSEYSLESQDHPLLSDEQDLWPIYCDLMLEAIDGVEASN